MPQSTQKEEMWGLHSFGSFFTPAKPKWRFCGNSLLAKRGKIMGREQECLQKLGFWDTLSSELCQFSH